VSADPQTIKPSCFNGLVWRSQPASNLQTCSEDFAMPALKINHLSSQLRKLG